MTVLAVQWEAVTAIATCLLALGLLGGFGAALFAAQQVREAQKTREALMAAEFFRRWNEEAMVEARRMFNRFKTSEELSRAFASYVKRDAPEAYVLYRELDYFEQLAALEQLGAIDVALVELLLGRTLAARWDMWKPALDAAYDDGGRIYPLFESLAEKMRRTDSRISSGI